MSDAVASSAPTNQSDLEAVPSSWPGAFGIYKHSKEAVKFNLEAVIIAIAAQIGSGIVLSILGRALNFPEGLISILQYVVSFILSIATIIILFAGVERTKITIGEAVQQSLEFLLNYFLQTLLLTVIILASLVALVVPFFFIAPRLVLAPYFLIKQKLGPIEATKASWEHTQGHVGKVYGIVGVNLLFALLCVTIIGIPFAIYFFVVYSAAFNILYAYVIKHAANTGIDAAPAA